MDDCVREVTAEFNEAQKAIWDDLVERGDKEGQWKYLYRKFALVMDASNPDAVDEEGVEGAGSGLKKKNDSAVCREIEEELGLTSERHVVGLPYFPVPPGTILPYRSTLKLLGLHQENMKGIGTLQREDGKWVTRSVAAMGGEGGDSMYEDLDKLDRIMYAGEGKGADQDMTNKSNRAMLQSSKNKIPVRVIRGYKDNPRKFAPCWGYRYDGLYVIKEAFEVGREEIIKARKDDKEEGDTVKHTRVWKFVMEYLTPQPGEDPDYTPPINDKRLPDAHEPGHMRRLATKNKADHDQNGGGSPRRLSLAVRRSDGSHKTLQWKEIIWLDTFQEAFDKALAAACKDVRPTKEWHGRVVAHLGGQPAPAPAAAAAAAAGAAERSSSSSDNTVPNWSRYGFFPFQLCLTYGNPFRMETIPVPRSLANRVIERYLPIVQPESGLDERTPTAVCLLLAEPLRDWEAEKDASQGRERRGMMRVIGGEPGEVPTGYGYVPQCVAFTKLLAGPPSTQVPANDLSEWACGGCADSQDIGRRTDEIPTNKLMGYKPGLQKKVAVRKTDDGKWELIADEDIDKDTYVLEVAGELISVAESHCRYARYTANEHDWYPLIQVSYAEDVERADPDWQLTLPAIDTRYFGNAARFVRHSEQTNLNQKMILRGQVESHLPVVGLFTNQPLLKGTPLTSCFGTDKRGEQQGKDTAEMGDAGGPPAKRRKRAVVVTDV
ncbi:unnamed protein product [Vitrella brassicaformis CCMP3155]|uniref:YDG domain-containing protein n=2 Tax=Vitrella brassicaformis TaxID=1169539 RepID=A0A0G4FVW6_VITBC|nr:unnamed protein product [Vitrella brassicaformis CCMP3155]|eukprot:CEM18749.1 unnamed protein product [Vitrella brassicaformis CCMP3155]